VQGAGQSNFLVLDKSLTLLRNLMTLSEFYADCVAPSGHFKFFLDDKWVESSSSKTVKILNPTTNQTAYEVQGEEA
jgi:hypothetical protein